MISYMRLSNALLVLALAACNENSAPSLDDGPTLQITNHAYAIICDPVCQPAAAIDPMIVGIWRNTGDTLVLLGTVSFDSRLCVRLAQSVGRAAGWKLFVKAYNQLNAPQYFSADTATDLMASPGWTWSIRDSVLSTGIVQHQASFAATIACQNPLTRP